MEPYQDADSLVNPNSYDRQIKAKKMDIFVFGGIRQLKNYLSK